MIYIYISKSPEEMTHRAQELCESRGGRPGLPVPNKRYGFCGRKATLNENDRAQARSAGGR